MLMQLSMAVLSSTLLLNPIYGFADQVKSCNEKQQSNCAQFCSMHQGPRSCTIDVTQKEGTCTCQDGTSHSRSK